MGGLSIANAFIQTDLAQWIGNQLNHWSHIHLILLIPLIVTIVTFMTEITSNIATASMVLLILAAPAISTEVPPYYLMVGAILAVLCVYASSGKAPNAIVFSSEDITMKDMIKTRARLK